MRRGPPAAGLRRKSGRVLGLGVEVEEFLDGGTQVRVVGTVFVEERAAMRRVQVDRLLKQRLHGFGRWLGHGACVPVLNTLARSWEGELGRRARRSPAEPASALGSAGPGPGGGLAALPFPPVFAAPPRSMPVYSPALCTGWRRTPPTPSPAEKAIAAAMTFPRPCEGGQRGWDLTDKNPSSENRCFFVPRNHPAEDLPESPLRRDFATDHLEHPIEVR